MGFRLLVLDFEVAEAVDHHLVLAVGRDVMDMQIAGLLLIKNGIEFHLGPPQAKKFNIFDQNIGINQEIVAEII